MDNIELWPNGPKLLQAAHARLTTDTVLLADFAGKTCSGNGADLGCASGALMVLLMNRKPELRMTGFEIVQDAVSDASRNLLINGINDRARIIPGDMRNTVKKVPGGVFDFIVANPPYYAEESGICSPEGERALARVEVTCTLSDLCGISKRLCRSGGRVYFSYRANRIVQLLHVMAESHIEPKRLRFVHHDISREAALCLVEGRRDGNPGLVVEPPLVLHLPDGNESAEYQTIYHRES